VEKSKSCLEGSTGFAAGACALSASVLASASARSAARDVACAVEGGEGGLDEEVLDWGAASSADNH
jgi:hypothetical protein